MSAPRLINPPPASGGVPVGGSGTVGTLPIWVGASTLGNSAVTQVSGSIFSLTGLVGGAGYSNTSSVSLGGGSGTGATASLIVSGGAVTWVQLLDPGSGYTAGDVLTIPGGVGGTIAVLAVVPKNDASGHFTAQRIGAGTTQPNAGVDSRYGAVFTGTQRRAQPINGSTSPITTVDSTIVRVGGDGVEDIDFSGATTLVGIGNFPRVSSATSRAVIGFRNEPQIVQSSGATSRFHVGIFSVLNRSYSTDTNTASSLRGLQLSVGHNNGAVAYTSPEITGITTTLAVTMAAGSTVTEARGYAVSTSATAASAGTISTTSFFRGAFINAASLTYTTLYGVWLPNASITAPGTRPVNYYPHAQEDTEGRNYFRSPTFFGSAVGTARSATNPSVEVEAVGGVSNGDVRLRSASAVFDASNSSTNGVRFFARTTGDLPTSTTQTWYEEGTYTPTGTGWQGTLAGSWTRVGRKVFVTINLSGSPNGNAAASTLTLPSGLAPARGGAGLRVKTATGTALGNGVCSVDPVSGLIQISTAVTVDNDSKTIQVEYEV